MKLIINHAAMLEVNWLYDQIWKSENFNAKFFEDHAFRPLCNSKNNSVQAYASLRLYIAAIYYIYNMAAGIIADRMTSLSSRV